MGLLQWVMFWILAPAAALGLDLTPAETPPEDFPGQQYIDSTGCVFLRNADAWVARQSRDALAELQAGARSEQVAQARATLASAQAQAAEARASLARLWPLCQRQHAQSAPRHCLGPVVPVMHVDAATHPQHAFRRTLHMGHASLRPLR